MIRILMRVLSRVKNNLQDIFQTKEIIINQSLNLRIGNKNIIGLMCFSTELLNIQITKRIEP